MTEFSRSGGRLRAIKDDTAIDSSNKESKQNASSQLLPKALSGAHHDVAWGALSMDTDSGRASFVPELLRGLRSHDPQVRRRCQESLEKLPRSALENHPRAQAPENSELANLIRETAAELIRHANVRIPKIRTTH